MELMTEANASLTEGEDGVAHVGENDITFDGITDGANKWQRVKYCLKKNVFLISVLFCAGLGFLIGFGLRGLGEFSEPALMWLGFPGEIFMRTLKLIILPLLVVSVITGSANLDPKTNGKITIASFMYMLTMNASGVLVGVTAFYIVQPHTGTAEQIVKTESCFGKNVKLSSGDIFADMIRNCFPDNMISACFQKAQTLYKKIELGPECGRNVTIEEYVKTVGSSGGINVLGIIFLCLTIGIACGKVGEKARPFVDFFVAASDVILMMLTWVVWLTPIGVLSLISTSIVRVNNIEATIASLAMFAATVIIAIIFHMFILVPAIYFAVFRKNPTAFLFHALRPIMTTFAPASSAIAIPEILNVVENVYGVDITISRFCTLFGAATSRCGSAAFIVICSLFLSYLDGITLDVGQVVYIGFLTTAMTFAVPSVPSASVTCVIIILSNLNVTPTNVGMILSLEWLLDRVRATNNVLVNLLGSLLINKMFG